MTNCFPSLLYPYIAFTSKSPSSILCLKFLLIFLLSSLALLSLNHAYNPNISSLYCSSSNIISTPCISRYSTKSKASFWFLPSLAEFLKTITSISLFFALSLISSNLLKSVPLLSSSIIISTMLVYPWLLQYFTSKSLCVSILS